MNYYYFLVYSVLNRFCDIFQYDTEKTSSYIFEEKFDWYPNVAVAQMVRQQISFPRSGVR